MEKPTSAPPTRRRSTPAQISPWANPSLKPALAGGVSPSPPLQAPPGFATKPIALEAQAPRNDPKLIETQASPINAQASRIAIQTQLIRARSKANRDSSKAIASRNTSPLAQASTIDAPAQPPRARTWASGAESIALAEHEAWAGFDLRYTIYDIQFLRIQIAPQNSSIVSRNFRSRRRLNPTIDSEGAFRLAQSDLPLCSRHPLC